MKYFTIITLENVSQRDRELCKSDENCMDVLPSSDLPTREDVGHE